MSLYIPNIGRAVPAHCIEQADAAVVARSFCGAEANRGPVLSRLYQKSGVATRHSVLLDSSTNGDAARQSFYPPALTDDDRGPTTATRIRVYEATAAALALQASREALANSQTSPHDVTHLVTVSCTGFEAPGVDLALLRELDLPAGTARTHLGFMGCHAALNGLRVARAFVEADPRACVLLCAVELCSLHYQYGWKPDQVVANALFADGAAALVARARPTVADAGGWRLDASASFVMPDSEGEMSWRIGDHGFEMTLSSAVPELIQRHLRPWLTAWLETHGLTIADIPHWAIHPGGPRILAACAEACGLAAHQWQASAEILAAYGNMSSPTILFILDRLQQRSAEGKCVALAFGPGLTIEAALFERSGCSKPQR